MNFEQSNQFLNFFLPDLYSFNNPYIVLKKYKKANDLKRDSLSLRNVNKTFLFIRLVRGKLNTYQLINNEDTSLKQINLLR